MYYCPKCGASITKDVLDTTDDYIEIRTFRCGLILRKEGYQSDFFEVTICKKIILDQDFADDNQSRLRVIK